MAVILSMDATLEEQITLVFNAQKLKAMTLRSSTIKMRIAQLNKLEKWVLSNRKTIQDAVYADYKKPSEEVDISEIFPVISDIRMAKKNLKKWAAPTKVDAPLPLLGTRSHVQYEPKGVCLIIAPWNYPFNLMIGPLVYAIAAGNTAILKPSEITPNTSAMMAGMIKSLFEEDEVALFEGGLQTSKALLNLPFDHIFFTGSPQVGKAVMKAAAKNLTSVTLELGGKSPVVVDKSANLKMTAQRITWGKFINVGQTCVAPDYILVEASVKKKLTQEIVAAIKAMYSKGSEQYKFSHAYGRIANERHFQRLKSMVSNATDKGATLVYGGDMDNKSRYISPTLLTDVTHDMEVMEEEIFGPVLPIIGYQNLDEAIAIINSKPKPLSLYVFTEKNKVSRQVLTETTAGTACINDCVAQFAHENLPFGGVNNSGIGKAHGYYSFLAFSNEKSVMKQLFRISSPSMLYPPYTKFTKRLIDTLLKYF